MLLIGFKDNLFIEQQIDYNEKIYIVNIDEFKIKQTNTLSYPVNLLEFLKTNLDSYDIIYIKYLEEIVKCLDVIKIPFSYIYNEFDVLPDKVRLSDSSKFILNDNFTLEKFLKQFTWYKPVELPKAVTTSIEHKKKTLQDLIDGDDNLTDLDVQDLKELQNKLKMGVLLQAKSMLKRVLQLTNILDKLYDEMLNRIEDSITTTDTASLMYTTKYISEALRDTNNFIVSLVNNEKIQNFFIIDNSTVINTGNDTYDIDKRERIRKAAEIILNNYDNLADNRVDLLVNPNEEVNK